MSLIENLEDLLARGQDNALLRYGLGAEYLQQERHGEAIAHLQAAVRHDPRYSAAWKLLGQALAAAGEVAQADATYNEGIAVAEARGDVQAAKEMRVFRKRLGLANRGEKGGD